MNISPRWDATSGKLALIDELLVDIAVRIQLSPTLHAKAVQHYEAINDYLDRPGSPLAGKIALFYPQGSMAIGATIRSKDEDDLFDIDLVAEIDIEHAEPGELLDLLFEALNGEPGSRYHGRVLRQTRCITVYYEDMHLDVTPLVRISDWPDRGGQICHAHEDDPPAQHRFVPANPWGFAEWFKAQTPNDTWFREFVLAKSMAGERLLEKAAPAEDVPDHESVFAKPITLVALQLTKRWARLNHEGRGGQGRCIPSVVFSRSFGENAGNTNSLVDELIYQSNVLASALVAAGLQETLIDLRNPALAEDCLTDRWPGDLETQKTFADDLQEFALALEAAKKVTGPEELKSILMALFGEKTAGAVMEEFYKRGGADVQAGRSRIVAGTGTAIAGMATEPAAATVGSPKHRNWGDES